MNRVASFEKRLSHLAASNEWRMEWNGRNSQHLRRHWRPGLQYCGRTEYDDGSGGGGGGGGETTSTRVNDSDNAVSERVNY